MSRCASPKLGKVHAAQNKYPSTVQVLYASLVVAGQEFTNYEWDQLLLEAGLVAAAIAPSILPSQPKSAPPPSGLALLLARLLLFKFLIMSGSEKVPIQKHHPLVQPNQ